MPSSPARCDVSDGHSRDDEDFCCRSGQVKCVPWLPSEPSAKRPLDLVPVRAAMAAPVTVLREAVRVEDLRQVRLPCPLVMIHLK